MELYPVFLDCGYSPLLFEQLSPAQIMDLIESHNRRQEEKNREYRMYMHDGITVLNAAILVLMQNLSALLPGSEKGEFSQLKDIFPELFSDDFLEKQSADKLPADLALYKAKRIDHAYRVNTQRAERS